MRLFPAILLTALLGGCRLATTDTPMLSARIQLGNPPTAASPGWVEEYVNFDMLCYSGNAWSGRSMRAAAKQLKELNPSIRLGEYMHVEAIGQWVFADVARGAPVGSWSRDYYDAVTPFLARTNQNDPATAAPDTASIFERNYCVNLLAPGAVEAVAGFYADHARGLDWFMLDFLSVPLPDFRSGQGPRYVSEQAGEMDLDQDGIAHAVDGDEQIALRQAYIRLLRALRERLPEDFLLIPNGALALVDDEIAKLCDGVYVEGFPQWFFRTGFEGAIFEPDGVPSLWSLTQPRYRHGKGLVLIEDTWNTRRLGAIAACFDGVVEVQRAESDRLTPDATRQLRELGPAQGSAILQENRLTRQFKGGTIVLHLKNGLVTGEVLK